MPLFGPPDVKKLELKRDVEGLIEALAWDKDPKAAADVHFDAAEALGLIGDPRAVGPLVKALWDPSLSVRWIAAEALGRVRDPQVVDHLADLLKAHLPYEDEPFRRVCEEAIKSLGRLGDMRAVEPLVEALASPVEELRHAAADALDKLGWHPDNGSAGGAYWVVKHDWLKCMDIGAPAVAPLCALLTTVDATTRMRAVETLGEIGDPRAVPALAKCLKDWRLARRETVVQALGRIGDTSAARVLVESLLIEDVRSAAIQALSGIGEPAVRPLTTALESPDMELVGGAAEAVAAMGPVGGRILHEFLNGPGQNAPFAVRRIVADAMGTIR